MARYIDADEIKYGCFAEVNSGYQQGWNDALNAASIAVPTADVVEVVRCKNCVKAIKESEQWKGMDKYLCDRHKSFVLGNDFCSYGERKLTKIEHNSLCETETHESR